MLEKLLSFLEKQRETLVELQKILVSTPALGPENGGTGERDKADKLKSFLAKQGLKNITEYNAPDSRVPCGHRPNLSLVIKGEDTSRTFWILSHMDVVPAGDRALWETDPFTLVVEGDEMKGRGVEDNHHGLTTSILLAKALHDCKVTPPINLGLLFVADEETGNKLGVEFLLENHKDLFGKDDLFLVPDSGEPKGLQIEVAEKSLMWIKITVKGKQCHAAMPHLGTNSLRAAAAFILKIDELHQKFYRQDSLFVPAGSTFNPTKKEANVPNVNTIPGQDVFYVDCRVLPNYKLAEVKAALEQLGQSVIDQYHVAIEYEVVHEQQAAPITDVKSPIVQRLMQAIEQETGDKPYPMGVGGGTVAAGLRKHGFPTVVWSTIYENPHEPNERANLRFALNDAKIMARVLMMGD